MNEKFPLIKCIKDIEKLCKVENFILENGRAITEDDKDTIRTAEEVMMDYTYGWYIYEETMLEQIKSINEFKIYVLKLIS